MGMIVDLSRKQLPPVFEKTLSKEDIFPSWLKCYGVDIKLPKIELD
jgi:hypothetical protein